MGKTAYNRNLIEDENGNLKDKNDPNKHQRKMGYLSPRIWKLQRPLFDSRWAGSKNKTIDILIYDEGKEHFTTIGISQSEVKEFFPNDEAKVYRYGYAENGMLHFFPDVIPEEDMDW